MKAFIWRRLHSLAGIWFTIYLMQHLFVNSQAALFIGDDGAGFVHGVNKIHELPYLLLIEFGILAVPILIHMIFGVQYLMTAKYNSFGDTGNMPYLPEYSRNQAYTWQRFTAWFLLFAVVAHVVHMRFIEYPASAKEGSQEYYMVRVGLDDGIQTLAKRLEIQIYDRAEIEKVVSIPDVPANNAVEKQAVEQRQNFIKALTKRSVVEGEGIAVAKSFGAAELMMLRETFKMPIMIFLYTIFVLTACYHGFNGLWTFLIKWGITLSQRSQRIFLYIANTLMVLVAGMGLAAIWLTYWVNLRE